MPTLPPAILAVVAPFAPLFSGRVWCHVQVLLAGTLLAPAQPTVAAALRALAPSERYDRERGRRHKALTDWARQLLLVVRRWWPERPIVAVADSSYAALEFLAACRAWPYPVALVTRLRLDAALYEPAPARR